MAFVAVLLVWLKLAILTLNMVIDMLELASDLWLIEPVGLQLTANDAFRSQENISQ